jgi:hypothetical protein
MEVDFSQDQGFLNSSTHLNSSPTQNTQDNKKIQWIETWTCRIKISKAYGTNGSMDNDVPIVFVGGFI